MRSANRAQSAVAANGPQTAAAKQECVKVVVRCRPLSERELADGNGKVVVELNCKQGTVQLTKPSSSATTLPGQQQQQQQQQSTTTTTTDKDGSSSSSNVKIYSFDSVYDGSSEQAELYADIFHPLVDSVLAGFNGTIFAYGQTGTGKTYTMEGTAEEPGVIPRSFTQIFSAIGRSSAKQFLVRSSYLEIYQESIRDLLATDVSKRLALRERPDTGVYVEDLSSFVCKSVGEIERVLVKGRANRAVGATNMNEHSSRSHAIFLVTIEHSERDPTTGVEHIRVGKLNLVDLAGSERLGKTQTAGKRAKEGITINLSLSALSNVISALVDGRTKRHIPYRDSKLTRLLQDSLGGNARTVMVANIGPSAYNYEETLTTLRYASRAKNIQNAPKINEDPKDTLLKEFQAEIERLRLQLEERRRLRLTASSVSGGGGKAASSEDISNDQQPQAAAAAATMIDVEASERLQARIRAMESKMLVGGKNIVDHTNEQQRELETRMDQLREQRQRERAMVRQLEEQEETTQEVRETFTSLQQEVEMKRRKLRKVVKEFQSINSEIGDLHETASEERRELERISSDLMRDLKLRYLIIDNFIPESEKTRFLRRVYYDENDEEWHMRPTSNSGSGGRSETSSSLSSMGGGGGNGAEATSENGVTGHGQSSRPGTAGSSSAVNSSRPSSAYYGGSSSDLSCGVSHHRLFLGFQVPFHVGPVDQLGLYMPERTTLDYNDEALLATFTTTNNSSANDDDSVHIEIIDIDEQLSHHHQMNGGGANRSTTAASSLNRRTKQQQQQQPRGQFSGGHAANWNDMAVGKTPPPMRLSLTVMNNYHDVDEVDDGGGGSKQQLGGNSSTDDINSLLDLKRATVRRKLCSSLSNHADQENHLNMRPDTAFPQVFPRSRGLVPK